jgi:hypothetical protein
LDQGHCDFGKTLLLRLPQLAFGREELERERTARRAAVDFRSRWHSLSVLREHTLDLGGLFGFLQRLRERQGGFSRVGLTSALA